MNKLELIDRLCSVVEEQAKLIKRQQAAIEQFKIIDDFVSTRNCIDDNLDAIEYSLRRII